MAPHVGKAPAPEVPVATGWWEGGVDDVLEVGIVIPRRADAGDARISFVGHEVIIETKGDGGKIIIMLLLLFFPSSSTKSEETSDGGSDGKGRWNFIILKVLVGESEGEMCVVVPALGVGLVCEGDLKDGGTGDLPLPFKEPLDDGEDRVERVPGRKQDEGPVAETEQF